MIADFNNTIPSVCAANPAVTFTNLSTGPGTLSWQWQFGDGATSTQANPVHTYTTPGTYTVSLIAISTFGCSDTVTKQQLIHVGVIQSQFTYPASVCARSAFTLTNTTTPIPASSTWNFGDGTTGIGSQPTKTYLTPGSYSIKLVNNFGACKDSVTHTILVNPKPVTSLME